MAAMDTAARTTVDIKVATPLPSSVMLTLSALIDAAWPGSELAHNSDPYTNQIIYRIDNTRKQPVSDDTARQKRIEPTDDDVEVTALGPQGVGVLTPQDVAANLLPVVKAAFEKFPDAQNYLEMPLRDLEDNRRYLLTFCRSAAQTPHELRMRAERHLATARRDVHRDDVEVVQRLLNAPRGGFSDSYRAGVEAALDALRQSHFAAVDIPEDEDADDDA